MHEIQINFNDSFTPTIKSLEFLKEHNKYTDYLINDIIVIEVLGLINPFSFKPVNQFCLKILDKRKELIGESNHKNGKWEGVCKWYHENGKLKSEGNFKDGK